MTQDPKDLDALIKAARDNAKTDAIVTAEKKPTAADTTDTEAKAESAEPTTPPKEMSAIQPEGLAKIRTFEHDAKTAIEDTNASLARMKLAEDKRERIANNPHRTSKVFWLVLIVLVLIGGGIAGYLVLMQPPKEPAVPVVIDEKPLALVSYDNYIDIDESNLGSLSTEALGITYVRVFNGEASAPLVSVWQNYFSSLPNIIDRNADDYMLGVHNGNTFLIIKTPYNYALPGMLEWEKQNTRKTYTDHFYDRGILRGDGTVFYAIREDGYIVMGTHIQTTTQIANSLF